MHSATLSNIALSISLSLDNFLMQLSVGILLSKPFIFLQTPSGVEGVELQADNSIIANAAIIMFFIRVTLSKVICVAGELFLINGHILVNRGGLLAGRSRHR
jgi:hypothetical protein